MLMDTCISLQSRGVRLPMPGEELEEGQEMGLMDSAEREELQQQVRFTLIECRKCETYIRTFTCI